MGVLSYGDVRDEILPGDVIAFAGQGFVSEIIQFATKSRVSHVGQVLQLDLTSDGRRVMLIEATSLTGSPAVQMTVLSQRVATYNGSIWWLPLNEGTRATFNNNASIFTQWALQQLGKPYSFLGAGASAVHDWLGEHAPVSERESYTSLFCSETVYGGLEVAGIVPQLEADSMTPKDVVELGIYARALQLRGAQEALKI